MEEIPFEDRQVPRAEIDWSRSAWWWPPLTRAIQPASKMFALATALIALWVAKAGVWLGVTIFVPDWQSATPPSVARETPLYGLAWLQYLAASLFGFESFGLREIAFFSFVAVWLSLVLSILGGVIARRALVELGQQSIAPWGESLKIVTSRWLSFLWSTGMHLVGITVLLIPVALVGLLARLGEIGATVAGVLLLIMFPIVFGLGRFAIGMIVCFPLSVCAIAAEKRADAFEGFSRSHAYFVQRPFVAALCCVILLTVGLVGEQLVYWTLHLGWSLASNTFNLAADGSLVTDYYLGTGQWLVDELICAFWFSYLWSAFAALYLILRKSVDNTEMDELDALVSSVEQSLPDIPSSPPENSPPETSPPENSAPETAGKQPEAAASSEAKASEASNSSEESKPAS